MQSGCPSTQKGGVLLCLSSLPKCQDPHASGLPSDQKVGGCVNQKRAILYAALLKSAFILVTPLTCSALWPPTPLRPGDALRRSGTGLLPSCHSLFQTESVSGANQFLLLLQHQRWKCRVRTPCLRGRDVGKDQTMESGGEMPCFHFYLRLCLFSIFTLFKAVGRLIMTCNDKSVLAEYLKAD